jgi:shikimate dehydrogenase
MNDRDFNYAVSNLSQAARLMGADTDFLLIGDPVAHSLSPQLHANIYDALASASFKVAEARGLKYGAIRVTPDGLPGAVRDIRSGGVRGFNVTIPHKKTVIPYIDELRGDAAASGAVNTVVKEGSKLIGYNTDMEGLRLAIRDMGKSYEGANISVLGTGGAAAGVCVKAALEGAAAVRVMGRNARTADEILRASRSAAGSARAGKANTVFEFLEYDFALPGDAPAGFTDALATTDILINATPLGMSGATAGFADFEFLGGLPDDAIVYDIVYNPEDTELTKAAKSRGLEAQSGLSMLIYQGILADILFLGTELDPHEIFESLKPLLH